MDFIELGKAIILGVLEGLTEFLPISSTGHLIIANHVLDFNDERAKVFDIFIQLGAILAIVWNYRVKVATVARGVGRDPAATRFVINLFIAFLPAAIFGLALHKTIKEHLFSPTTVAVALIVGGIAILLVEKYKPAPRIHHVDDMSRLDALKVGLAQSLALFPGVSRSGATIMGSLMLGLSRTAATEFSFFIAIPTMLAATTYDLYKNVALLKSSDILLFATGFVCAFASALLVVRSLLRYIANHDFRVFAYYRLVLGPIVLLYFYW